MGLFVKSELPNLAFVKLTMTNNEQNKNFLIINPECDLYKARIEAEFALFLAWKMSEI